MDFAMASCLNSPSHFSLFPTTSSFHSDSLAFSHRNAHYKKNKMPPMACIPNNNNNNNFNNNNNGLVFNKRRAILFVGLSILPILKLRPEAVEGLAAEDSLVRTQEQKETAEQLQARRGDVLPNPFLAVLNVIGIFGSSVLGVLFALVRKEKAATEATLELTKLNLMEMEAVMVSLQKKLESELQNEKEERCKQLKIADEERQSLINQLHLANNTISGLGRELKNNKRIIEELGGQIDSLTTSLAKAVEYKEKLENELKEKLNLVEVLQERMNSLTLEIKGKEDNVCDLRSRLAAKESEFNQLSSIYEKSNNEVVSLNSALKGLKDDLLKSESQLELKNAAIHDLNAKMSSLIVERDDSNRKVSAIEEEYNNLKLSAEEMAASDAKLLEESAKELNHIKEQLEIALTEVSKQKVLVADTSRERDMVKETLDGELKTVSTLYQEVQLTQEALGKSRSEVSDMVKQLQQSRNLYSQLNDEISKVRVESAEAMDSLRRKLVKENQNVEALSSELKASQETLRQKNEELQIMSGDLAAVVENGGKLRKEFVEVYKKAENAVQELNEEKETVTSLNEKLRSLDSQILKDKDARKSLETDLEDTNRSLNEMNEKVLLLSKDVELANSQIPRLKDEKDTYYTSLSEQKQLTREAKENLNEAHNLVMRLGKEREKLGAKSKNLEEELACAKGEMLRLRSQIKTGVKKEVDQKRVDGKKVVDESKDRVPAKKTSRRKKVASKENL